LFSDACEVTCDDVIARSRRVEEFRQLRPASA